MLITYNWKKSKQALHLGKTRSEVFSTGAKVSLFKQNNKFLDWLRFRSCFTGEIFPLSI